METLSLTAYKTLIFKAPNQKKKRTGESESKSDLKPSEDDKFEGINLNWMIYRSQSVWSERVTRASTK